MNKRWTWAVWIAALLCVPALALAAARHGGNNVRAGKARKHAAVWLVNGVTSNSVTLAKSDQSDSTNLTVGFGAEIMVKGQPGKLADVLAGMRAEFTAMGDKCSRLAVYNYTPPAGKPKGGRHGGKKKPL